MIDTLIQLDHALTITINHFHTSWLDPIMIAISGKFTWIPLYALLAFMLFKKFGWKGLAVMLLGVTLTIVLADQISVAFKNYFERPRPCHEPSLIDMLYEPIGCGGKFGFVSSHAANTMALAVFVSIALRKNWISFLMLAFAVLNSYSRVYLAKHYVGDVLCGMMLGMAIGYGTYYLANMVRLKWVKS